MEKISMNKWFKFGAYIADTSDYKNQIANNILVTEDEFDFSSSEINNRAIHCIDLQGVGDYEYEINKKTHSTFLVRQVGDSMINSGIKNGDILLVDSSLQAINNSIVVAEYNNNIIIRRISFIKNKFVLFPDNVKKKHYKPIVINKTDNLIIWGVIIYKINTM